MIPLSAPSISASVAPTNGPAPSASPKGAEAASFAAMLGANESAADPSETPMSDLAAALVAALAGLPDGKSGKAGGKNLPVGDDAHDDLETSETPDEAISGQADVPIAAAIPVLPLHVPPLPGIGNPVEFRAAVPDNVPAHAAAPQVVARAATTATAAQQAMQQQAADRAVLPAQVLNVALDPIVTAEVLPQTDAKGSQIPAVGTAAQLAAVPAATSADARTPEQKAANPNQDPLVLSLLQDAEPAAVPASLDKLRTSGSGADFTGIAQGQLPRSRSTEASSPQAPATGAPPEAPVATAEGTPKRGDAEPKETLIARDRPATTVAGLDRAAEIAQPVLHQVHSASQPAPASRTIDAAPAAGAAPVAADQPHDFATLVDRLSQAREAASPQIVRTALQHAEFGRVSLQFRHDDANLSVTLANADPAFNSAVNSAVAASLAGNSASQENRSDTHQQYQPASQQQSAASGSGSQGQQQSAQARAEQAERTFQRAQGSSARAERGDTASSERADRAARRSGIYA